MNDSKLRTSVLLRMVIVAALDLALLIPTLFVYVLISERQERHDSAVTEVTQSWGGGQTLTGPILTLPYKVFSEKNKSATAYDIHYIHILPSRLMLQATLNPEIRYRGIYQIALYNARIACEGEFPQPEIDQLSIDQNSMLWDEAFVTLGISDLKGLRDSVNLNFDSSKFPSEPGVIPSDGIETGMTFKTKLDRSLLTHHFSFQLNLNGSSEMRFTPTGKETQVTMDSPWSDPSFVGGFLPETRVISSNAFRAQWKVLNLNRNFPQTWIDSRYKLTESSFGMKLLLPVDEYQKTARAVKYAILFISLTFVAFFLSEVIAKIIIHPVQYSMIGFAVILFYLLLLATSEHIPFNVAYGISSVAVVALVALYSRWITLNNMIALVISCVLITLYGFLFVTLQLQDYALIVGSIGLFFTLLIVMYLTRHIDWFSLGNLTQRKEEI